MSGGSRMRYSKWENKDSDAVYDRAPPRRPREPFSPDRGSRRHDNRTRESTMTLERERNCTRSPEQDDWRVRHLSQSPRYVRGRSHRISRSRSRSQSPARNFRREPEINDRSNMRSGSSGTICRNFVAGRCKRGHNCLFVHDDSQLYDSRRSLEGGPPDDWDGNAMRAKKSAHICNDFLKGRCRRGDTCKFVHHDSSFDVFEKGQGEEVYRNRGHEHRYRDRSQDTYRDHDHRGGDTYPDRGHRSRGTYSDHDHRRKGMYTDRNHQSESHRSVEIPPCKYFVSGHCRNGSRCRFSHQVQEVFSPKRKSRDDNRDTDRKFEGSRGWDGPGWDSVTTFSAIPAVPGWEDDKSVNKDRKGLDRKNEGEKFWDGPGWDDVTTVSTIPTVPGWEDDKSENKDGKGPDRKNEGDKVWDGPAWDDVTVSAVSTVPGWEDDKNEKKEDWKGLDRKNEGDQVWNGPSWNDNNETRDVAKDSWSHDMLIKPTWDQPATFIDKTQIEKKEDPLQLKTESTVLKGRDIFSGDMEISPRDVKKESIFDSSTSQTLSSSNTCFPDHHTDLFGEKNSCYKDNNKPVLYSAEGKDVVQDRNGSSIIQNLATTVPQVQGIFQSDKTVNVHPIPEISPPSQSQTPVLLHAPQGEGIQEVGGGPHGNVNKEQLAQLSHLTASLTQLLGNRQQFPQLSSLVSSHDMPNLPIPDLTTQPSQVLKQYDHASSRIEQKNAINEIRNEGYNSNPQEHLKQLKEEKCKDITGFKAGEYGPSQDVDPDKDLKGGVRPFKFALVEFVKGLLKPFWKEGQVSKEAYKTIVKKVVDKVMETLGAQIPQTNEKIDLYLSCSKPKIDKLVQAYVGKHQKGQI